MGAVALLGSPAWAQSYDQRERRAPVGVDVFYDGLAPYGDWLELPGYGWSWAPRVDRDWRPYTRGQWVMTDDGWFWDSDEEFGWATYHYGRWVDEPYYGWVWIPGTEWAPAWVSWRHGDGYTGWAPLPPRARWQARVGLRIGGLDIDAFIGGRDYTFVPDGAFMDRGVYQRVLPWTRNAGIIERTSNVTRYGYANQRVVNTGLAVSDVEQAIGRSVPRARTVDVEQPNAPRRTITGEVSVFRPEVREAPDRRPAQGRSVLQGEAPPPLLVQRVRERNAAQQRPVTEPRDPVGEPRNQRDTAQQQAQQAAQQQAAQQQAAQQQAAQQQAQQRADRERAQANDQLQRNQRDAAQQQAQQDAQRQAQQAAQQQAAQQQAVQQQAAQQRADREKAQANDQQLRNQRDAAQQQAQQDAQRQAQQAAQQAAQQQAQQQAQQRADREKAQANDQHQRNQQQEPQSPPPPQSQRPADREKPQTNDSQPPPKQQEQPATGGGNAQAADGKHGKDAPPPAKDNPKDRGKGKDKKAPPEAQKP